TLDGFLHVPSGIVTRLTDQTRFKNPDSYLITGDPKNLISYAAPPQLYVDGRQAEYKGQGPFMTSKYVWYMSVSDYASAVQATITRVSGATVLTRGNYTLKLSDQDKSLLNIGGSKFAPLETLNNSLGIAAAFHQLAYTKGYNYDRLLLFSKDFSEEQFLAAFPDATHPEEFTDLDYYTMSGAAPVLGQSDEEHSYDVYNGIRLIYGNGKLISASSKTGIWAKTLRDVGNDENTNTSSDIVAAYGTLKVFNSGKNVLRTYNLPYSTLLFQSKNNTIGNLYYIVKP
ncbi:hypothetical protein KC345_g11456, partial [Hortaea werneckii]